MHIAFFVVKHPDLGGGIEKYTRELSMRLAARGHEITVYSMRHYGDFDSVSDGIRIVRVPTIPMRAVEKLGACASAAALSLFRRKPDIAHFHSVAAGLFAPLCRWRGIPRVLQMHGIEWQRSRWGGLGSSVLRFLERTSMKGMDAYTAVSRVQCDLLATKYGVPVEFIPTGADVPEPTPAQEIQTLGLKPNEYILFASRLVHEKGAHYLIPAFRKLNTNVKLVIAGDAKGEETYKEELRQLADGDSRIVFPGFVQGDLLKELFSNARLYVHPSELEGLSIALLEAMGYGNACLVSDIPENEEALADTGFYFRGKSVESLATELDALLSHPEITRDMGAKARIRVKTCFSWDHIADAFENMYKCVIEARATKEHRSQRTSREPAKDVVLRTRNNMASMVASRLVGVRACCGTTATATALLEKAPKTSDAPELRTKPR
jgi:glycosyltransferase involved in cell wall biosynthesis